MDKLCFRNYKLINIVFSLLEYHGNMNVMIIEVGWHELEI